MLGRSLRRYGFPAAVFAAFVTTASPQPQPAAPPQPQAQGPISASGERVFAYAKTRLVQVRTLLPAANRQSTLGSAFFVSEDGLAITNYHVVSQFALEPRTYALEYIAPDGAKGPLRLLAIDVANDLAVVKVDQGRFDFFELDARAVDGTMAKGERLYSMGNPLDLGFTIVEGTYNGLVDKSYNEQVHFSGAINPGMSGGPTTTAAGKVAGVNVAKRLDGELVSFLVPARFAAALIQRAREGPVLDTAKTRAEIGRQLKAWQASFYKAALDTGFKPAAFGPYRAPESAANWVQCWANTNAEEFPKPRARRNTTRCSARTSIFVAGDLRTGTLEFSHDYLQAIDLNSFQFASFASQQYRQSRFGFGFVDRKRLARQDCVDDFVEGAADGQAPPLRVRVCARGYRDFDGLYDVSVSAITQDRGLEALVTTLQMRGIEWGNAMALVRAFLSEVRWAK